MLDDQQVTNIIAYLNNCRRRTLPRTITDEYYIKYGEKFRDISYVRYMDGKFAYFDYYPNNYAVSDGFSGCIFCKYCMNGNWYIAHIANDHLKRFVELSVFFAIHRINEYMFFFPNGGNDELWLQSELYRKTLSKKIPVRTYAAGVIYNDRCYSLFYAQVGNNSNYKVFYQIEWLSAFSQGELIVKNYQMPMYVKKYYDNNPCVIA